MKANYSGDSVSGDITTWVQIQRASQGLPPRIDDDTVLATLRTLIRASVSGGKAA